MFSKRDSSQIVQYWPNNNNISINFLNLEMIIIFKKDRHHNLKNLFESD